MMSWSIQLLPQVGCEYCMQIARLIIVLTYTTTIIGMVKNFNFPYRP